MFYVQNTTLRRRIAHAFWFVFAAWMCLHGSNKASLASDSLLDGWKTLGGRVYWTDQVIHGDWRIQQNVVFGHYRLLDPRNRRIRSGSIDACFRELEARRLRRELTPLPKHVVIVMHGLAGSRKWMSKLSNSLSNSGGYTVLSFGYASTKGTIQEHAVALESVIRNLQGVHEVSFVGHSLSNIVVRHMLYRLQTQNAPPPVAFRRMVMISPPNHGANLADSLLGQSLLAKVTLGDVVDQLAPSNGWPAMQQQLVTPWFEFGIIAGGKGDFRGYLRNVPGDDDALLSIATHLLNGASEFKQVGGIHQMTPRHDETIQATLNFLKFGHF